MVLFNTTLGPLRTTRGRAPESPRVSLVCPNVDGTRRVVGVPVDPTDDTATLVHALRSKAATEETIAYL